MEHLISNVFLGFKHLLEMIIHRAEINQKPRPMSSILIYIKDTCI